MDGINSIVIVRANSKGYTATLRFSNPKKDTILSGESKYYIYGAIERYVRYIGKGGKDVRK